MSHLITKIDSHVGLAQAWHGLTDVVPAIVSGNCRLNWEVKTSPYSFGVNGTSIETETNSDGRIAAFSTVEGKDYFIGEHSDKYAVIQNMDIVDQSINALVPHGLKLSSAGSLKGRKLIYLTFDNNGLEDIGGEKFKTFFNVYSSHDGSQKLMMRDSNERIVCANTWKASKESLGNFALSVRHTTNAQIKLEGWAQAVNQIVESRKVWASEYVKIKNQKAKLEEARFFFAGFLGGTDSKKSANRLDTLVASFQRGKGNNGQSRGDIFNAITEAYTHNSFSTKAGKGDRAALEKGWFASEFGNYADKKAQAFDIIRDAAHFAKLVAKGKVILAKA